MSIQGYLSKILGHVITKRCIEADPTKLRVVANMLPPKPKKQIQKFNDIIVPFNKFFPRI